MGVSPIRRGRRSRRVRCEFLSEALVGSGDRGVAHKVVAPASMLPDARVTPSCGGSAVRGAAGLRRVPGTDGILPSCLFRRRGAAEPM